MVKFNDNRIPILLGLTGIFWGISELSLDKYFGGFSEFSPLLLILHFIMGIVLSCVMIFIYFKIRGAINKYIQDLYSSKERYSLIFENCPVGIAYFDLPTKRMIECNPKFLEVLGAPIERIIDFNVTEIKDENLKSAIMIAFSGEVAFFEGDYISVTGDRKFYLKAQFQPIISPEGCCLGVIGIIEDISAKKKAENAFDQIEARFKLYVEKCPDGIFVVNNQGDYVDVNPRGCSLLGYSKEELLQKNLQEISLPNDGVGHFQKLKEMGEITRERYLAKKDGTQLPVELKAVSLGDDLFMAYIRDVSKRKQFEAALRKSEEQYRVIFENCPLGFIHFDQTGVITHSNDRFINLVGATREKIIGFNMFTDIQDLNMKRAVETALAGKVGHYEGNYISITSGKKLTLKVMFNPITSKAGEFLGVVGIHEDISEKKNFEKEMARLDSLNMVGQIAAGIGHEVRNPMTTVRGFLQLLAEQEINDEKKGYYDLMIDELDRANSIITEFLSLARDRHVELKHVSLNVIINALHPLLNANSMNNPIVLNLGDIPKISSNEKDIRQLIINLVRNALEASPPREVIIISTYVYEGEVVLTIEDKGTGIPPEIHDNVGTPFVTTKENGTGLGLSICYSIAHKHNAKIDFKTGSSGTTFYVRFKIDGPHQEQEAVDKLERLIN